MATAASDLAATVAARLRLNPGGGREKRDGGAVAYGGDAQSRPRSHSRCDAATLSRCGAV
ncbi:hypothetical protein ASD86_14630 [Lysobacter sp. Root690]|nr:hypothetical protein ASD86_14630 [Lysobacter sp. Root690]